MTSAPAISFDYRPSRLIALAGLAMGAVSFTAFLFSDVPGWIRWPGMVATVFYVWQWLRQRTRSRVAGVLWHGDGSFTVNDAAGNERQALLVSQRRFAGVVLLDLRWEGGRQHLLLARDNLPEATLRDVRIRLGAAGKGAAA